MKWTEKEDQELINLISDGKRHDEISLIMKRSKKSISCRCHRLSIHTVYTKEYSCTNCLNTFIDSIKTKKKFCSHSCHSKWSWSNGIFNYDEDKRNNQKVLLSGKKRDKLIVEKTTGDKNGKWIDGRSISKRPVLIDGKKICINCKELKDINKRKRICEDCRYNYYEIYRPSCEFRFSINRYSSEFDTEIAKENGWYSPTNKNNNLYGVSRDHLYSVMDGYKNRVPVNIISHPANCKLVLQSDNSSKGKSSSITLKELFERIRDWNEKYQTNLIF